MNFRVTSVATGFAIVASIAALMGAQSARAPIDPPISFEKDVQPILEKNCLSCHGETMQGRLDLRSRDGALKGGARGAAFSPRARRACSRKRSIGLVSVLSSSSGSAACTGSLNAQ